MTVYPYSIRERRVGKVTTPEKKAGQSLKQTVYEDLKHQIIACEILPGAQLTEEALCEQFNASRTPVRDAVGRLEQEQLVTIHPKKGIFVNTVSLSNVSELFEARLRIEPYAVKCFGNRIDVGTYADYCGFFSEHHEKGREQYNKDDAFHQMFVDATQNRYLKMFYSIVKDQVMRYRVLSALETRLADTNLEHLEVVQQCMRGNWSRAAEAMRVHIENSKIAIFDYVMKQNRDARNIFAIVATDAAEG